LEEEERRGGGERKGKVLWGAFLGATAGHCRRWPGSGGGGQESTPAWVVPVEEESPPVS